ncbi:hypothetical protein DAPPUDRAFT_259605 [Daphnia pulex]|uniref:Uncharacterized protein n=1 Tax=Daphnia pulex TaxID=6669 RepID=E9HHH9_DAPPU|nr:hypothetical protein DAPPUDRAFT_259605 [Daphnia pulex]|eukprot:EFX68812.1 hypothetical protein DAPPUDRAFT_259605 [Daphnia pulex]
MTVAVDAHLETVCMEDDIEWNQLVAPAPTGIAGLGQLLIWTTRVTDFKIDKINKEDIHLIKSPDSFRTTLLQIANDSYNAFMKAHTNMEKIQLQMAQLPNYVKDCIKYMKSGKQVVLEKLLPKRLNE